MRLSFGMVCGPGRGELMSVDRNDHTGGTICDSRRKESRGRIVVVIGDQDNVRFLLGHHSGGGKTEDAQDSVHLLVHLSLLPFSP